MNHADRVRCPHCQSASVSSFYRFENQESFRCDICGGFFNIPPGQSDTTYDSDYYRRNYLPRESAQLDESRRLVKTLSDFAPGGSLLDYGCGAGIFLQAACEAGFTDNIGADISADALRIAAQKELREAEWINLAATALPRRTFDIITLMDSISHIPDVRATVENLRDTHLAEGGVLVIRTPDIPPIYFAVVRASSVFIGRRYTSSLLFARSRYALFDAARLRRFLLSLGFVTVYEERRREYAMPISWSSPVRAFKEIVQRVVSAPIRSVFFIAKRVERGR